MKNLEVLAPEIRSFFEAGILRFKFSVEHSHSSSGDEMTSSRRIIKCSSPPASSLPGYAARSAVPARRRSGS